MITDRIYQTLDGLISPTNYLEGYLKLAGRQVPVSSADFWPGAITQKGPGTRSGRGAEAIAHRR